jgi:hypothetical protein
MSENSNDTEEQNGERTEINASLAALEISVETEGQEEAEELFYNVWEFVVEDAEDMSDSMRDRLSGSN